jgi:hypothetical protein
VGNASYFCSNVHICLFEIYINITTRGIYDVGYIMKHILFGNLTSKACDD